MLEWSLVGWGVGAWALGLSSLACAQRRLIFRRPTHIRSLPAGPWAGSFEIEPLVFEVVPGVCLQGWRSRPASGVVRGTLLHFGGRGEHVAWAPHMSSWLRDWSVLAFNYRGFGFSTGRPGEAEVMHDALAIHGRFIAPLGPAHPLVVTGRSLGSAVAVHTARRVQPQALVLFSPLSSVRSLVRRQPLLAPASALLHHPMDALADAAGVHCPTLLLLAAQDRQIPHAHSHRLARRLGGSTAVREIAGTQHRTLPRSAAAQQAVVEFFTREGLLPALPGAEG